MLQTSSQLDIIIAAHKKLVFCNREVTVLNYFFNNFFSSLKWNFFRLFFGANVWTSWEKALQRSEPLFILLLSVSTFSQSSLSFSSQVNEFLSILLHRCLGEAKTTHGGGRKQRRGRIDKHFTFSPFSFSPLVTQFWTNSLLLSFSVSTLMVCSKAVY